MPVVRVHPQVKPGRLDIAHPLQPGARLQDAAGTVLCMLFGMYLGKSPETSDQNVFCGSKGNHQLAATHKVNPGFVFPLKSGLAFVERVCLSSPPHSFRSTLVLGGGGPGGRSTLRPQG
jgi:hypothetical protein